MRVLVLLLLPTQSWLFHGEDEDEVRGLCGLHEPNGSSRSVYPWVASVRIGVNIKLFQCSHSWGASAVSWFWRSSSGDFLRRLFGDASFRDDRRSLLPTWRSTRGHPAWHQRQSASRWREAQHGSTSTSRSIQMNHTRPPFWAARCRFFPDSQSVSDPPVIRHGSSQGAGRPRLLRLWRGSAPADGGCGRLLHSQVTTTSFVQWSEVKMVELKSSWQRRWFGGLVRRKNVSCWSSARWSNIQRNLMTEVFTHHCYSN